MLIECNEGKACDAVLKRIEICSGETRSGLWHPELEQDGPPVDLRVTVGPQEYAIEHTLLQPYPDSISDFATFKSIHEFIREQELSPLPGSVHYQLRIPYQVSLPKRKTRRDKALRSLLEWIVDTAQQLHERRWEVPRSGIGVNNCIRGKPNDFEQDFELFRWPDRLPTPYKPGVLSMAFSGQDNIEQLLRSSMDQAFAKKFPKLFDCKQLDVRTVLTLEGINLPVGHHHYIGNILRDLLAHRKDCPDEIYLVEPDREIQWWVWPLKRDSHHWPTASLPSPGGSYFPLGQRPPEEMSEWYHQLYAPFEVSSHIPLAWHPAFFKEEDLRDLAQNRAKRPPDCSMP